jgi:hypothetical protein
LASTPSRSQLFVRVAVRYPGVFVRMLTVFVSRCRVLLRFFVLAGFVMMGRLVMMMRGGVMVACGLMMMVACRVLRRLCHVTLPSVCNGTGAAGDTRDVACGHL